MPDQRRIAHFAYRILMANFILLITNLACNCSYVNAGSANADQVEYIGMGAMLVLFGIPVSAKPLLP